MIVLSVLFGLEDVQNGHQTIPRTLNWDSPPLDLLPLRPCDLPPLLLVLSQSFQDRSLRH